MAVELAAAPWPCLRRSLEPAARPLLRPDAIAATRRQDAIDAPRPRRLLESNPAGGRAVAVTNIRGKDAPALRLAFAKVGI